jgi:single-strand DNA-binding protein
MYLNKAIIIGNLTRDPELKSLPSGIKVASFSVATNRTWKDQTGAKKEAVEYHNVVAFGKQAELIAQYCKKGNSIYVEGRMQTRSWDAQDGSKKYRSEIIIENFQFGPKGSGMGGGDSSYAQSGAPAAKSAKKDDDTLETIEYPEEDINAEDIPF